MDKFNPKFCGIIKNGKLKIENKKAFADWFSSLEGKKVEITIKRKTDKRSISQNNALHLYFSQLADAFNDAGIDMRKVLKQDAPIPWTGENVKEYLWRPIQKTMLKKESTTQLNKQQDIDKIYDVLNRHLGERFGVHVDFPSLNIN